MSFFPLPCPVFLMRLLSLGPLPSAGHLSSRSPTQEVPGPVLPGVLAGGKGCKLLPSPMVSSRILPPSPCYSEGTSQSSSLQPVPGDVRGRKEVSSPARWAAPVIHSRCLLVGALGKCPARAGLTPASYVYLGARFSYSAGAVFKNWVGSGYDNTFF